jgi:carbon-monoxide dehydrogenase iron sulfur subunit
LGYGVAAQAAGGRGMQVYSILTVDVEKCTGCRTCEIVCSLKNYGECNPSRARISVVRDERDGLISTIPVVCQQCVEPLCLQLCPAQALTRNAETNAVVVSADKCIGCRTCVQVCPYGAPFVDPRSGVSQKCDLCGGQPTCSTWCPNDALQFVSADEEALRRRRTGVTKYLELLQSQGGQP